MNICTILNPIITKNLAIHLKHIRVTKRIHPHHIPRIVQIMSIIRILLLDAAITHIVTRIAQITRIAHITMIAHIIMNGVMVP